MKIPCQFPGCDVEIEHESEAVAIVMYTSHSNGHLQSTNRRTATKPPQISRPEVKQDISTEEWYSFLEEWKRFKRITDLATTEIADQLFQCCEQPLRRLLLKENPAIIDDGEKVLLEAIRKMAVLQVATSVRRTKLLATKQEPGQLIREYYANVRATASTCDFTMRCTHSCCAGKEPVDYTSKVVKDILVAGIADTDIRKDVLGHPNLDSMLDKDIVKFVEEKEMAKNAVSATSRSDVNAMSNYRRQGKDDDGSKKKLTLKGKCATCSEDMNLYIRYRSGKMNKEPFKCCIKCHKETQKTQNANKGGEVATNNSDNPTSFIDSLSSFERGRSDTW